MLFRSKGTNYWKMQQQPCSSSSLEGEDQKQQQRDGNDFSREFIDQIFAQCDSSGTGFIGIKKLKIVMRALGLEPRQDEINKITKKMLANEAARSVNKDAFCAEELAYVLADRFKESEVKDEIHSAFGLFDVEGKGYITIDDLRRISNELGESLTDDELKVLDF